VVCRSVLRAFKKTDSHLVAVTFEVVPEGGGPRFIDQENLFVRGASL
jgi:hypothetical protein